MAVLERTSNQTRIHLPADALIGRGSTFDVPLHTPAASAPHAILRWARDRWQLRDLGSLNGTFLNGRRLDPGRLELLAVGSVLQFGGAAEELRLIDGAAPVALARHIQSGVTVPMRDGLLLLPDDEHAVASIYEGDDDSQLQLDMPQRLGMVVDREVINLDGELWQLRVSCAPERPTTYMGRPILVDSMVLSIEANRDWSSICCALRDGDRQARIPHYAHNELLLVLALQRVEDARDGATAEECGWLAVDQVCRRLARTREVVNVLVHQARLRFQRNNVVPAADVIQRRPGQMRLGIVHIELAGWSAAPPNPAECAAAGDNPPS